MYRSWLHNSDKVEVDTSDWRQDWNDSLWPAGPVLPERRHSPSLAGAEWSF